MAECVGWREGRCVGWGAGLEAKLKARAAGRGLEDLTAGPVLSWTTERMLAHKDALLKIPGAPLPRPPSPPPPACHTMPAGSLPSTAPAPHAVRADGDGFAARAVDSST